MEGKPLRHSYESEKRELVRSEQYSSGGYLALPYQHICGGRLEQACGAELKQLCAEKAVERLWAKDTTLWEADESHTQLIQDRLGWIGALDRMRSEAAEIEAFAAEVEDAGLRDIVLVGTGESTLAAEVFTRTFPAPEGRRFFLLDSTAPDSIRALEGKIELGRTLFLVASKSGKAIETISQFLYFLDRVKTRCGGPPGGHFAAITDQETFIGRVGPSYSFRKMFLNAYDLSGRFSALTYFGLVPAALWGCRSKRSWTAPSRCARRAGQAGRSQIRRWSLPPFLARPRRRGMTGSFFLRRRASSPSATGSSSSSLRARAKQEEESCR